MIEHVIFDLDGTLADSAPGISACLAHAIRVLGAAPPSFGELRAFIGTPLEEIFAAVVPGACDDDVASAVDAYRVEYRRSGAARSPLFPGIPEALDALRERGHRLAVATAKRHDEAATVVRGLGLAGRFDAVVGSDRARGVRSKTDVLRACVEELGARPARIAMVGDRHHDVRAARELGAFSIGVAWGYGARAELDGAHAIANAPRDLLDLVARAA